MGSRKFILSYVNEAANTANYDRVFYDISQLITFAEHNHPEYTSYQVIVMAERPSVEMTEEKFEDLTRRAT